MCGHQIGILDLLKCYYEVYSQVALTMNYQFVRLIVREIFMNNKTIEMLRGGDTAGPGPFPEQSDEKSLSVRTININCSTRD